MNPADTDRQQQAGTALTGREDTWRTHTAPQFPTERVKRCNPYSQLLMTSR